MDQGLIVRLRPAGPWRFGSDTGASHDAGDLFHSDSVYSAVTHGLAQLGELEPWLRATAEADGEPAVRFSSCYPWLEDDLFIVPPRNLWPPSSTAMLGLRNARFVPLRALARVFRGEDLPEDKWTVDAASRCLVRSPQRGAARGPFRPATRHTAAVDRLSSTSGPHRRIACVEFAANAGLWLAVTFANEAARDRWVPLVEAAFRLLGDSGLGGRRSAGWGRFAQPEFTVCSLAETILPGLNRKLEAPAAAALGNKPAKSPADRPADRAALNAGDSPGSLVSSLKLSPETRPDGDPGSGPEGVPGKSLDDRLENGAEGSPGNDLGSSPQFRPEGNPENEPERNPGGRLEGSPGDGAKGIPENSAEGNPEDGAGLNPGNALEGSPGDGAEGDPEDSAEGGPGNSLESSPVNSAESSPENRPEPNPGSSLEADPGIHAEGNPENSAEPSPENRPEGSPEDRPGGSVENSAGGSPGNGPERNPENSLESSPENKPGDTPEPAAVKAAGEQKTGYWMLSLYHPNPGDSVDWEKGFYAVTMRGGRVESSARSGNEKKLVRMVSEGSVIVAENRPTGAAANVAPQGFPHPVYRYGRPVSLLVPLGGTP